MRIAVLLLIVTLETIFANSAILQLDTGGHTALIRDIVVTKDQKIISASDDKTIHIWNPTTGKEERKILGQIGAGYGEIFAIALSPDSRFLAVGGYFESDDIRIYNYQTGALVRVLKSHTNVVHDLAFSPDGAYLISGSADSTAKIWKMSNFTLHDTIKFHTASVYGVKLLQKGQKYYAVTAGLDNRIALYDMQSHKIVRSDTKPYKLLYLATSKEHIAVCGSGKEIAIYDYNLKPITTIASETEPSGLAYSPNGAWLVAGSRSDFSYELVNLYSVAQNYQKQSSFQKHTNVAMAVNFLDNQRAISGGGENNEIYIWDIQTAGVQQKIEGSGDTVRSVGIQGETIAWGNTWTATKGKSKFEKTFNLQTLSISEKRKTKSEKFKRIATTQGKLTLSHQTGGSYGYSDATLLLKENGETKATITRDSTNGYRHRCYGFYKNMIISGGAGGYLKIYNLQGEEIANLVGHTGVVWSIAVDGDRLVSGGEDQTIRVWDLGNVTKKSRGLTIYPALNIFVSRDNEWVIWSNKGYYNASLNGAKYVGYHINQGANKEALYVSSKKYKELFRPDIVDFIIQGKSEEEAIALANKSKRVRKVDVVAKTPPTLVLHGKEQFSTTKDSVTIKFTIQSKAKIENIRCVVNGELINRKDLQRNSALQRVTVRLKKGENKIAIMAIDKNRMTSDPLMVKVTRLSNSREDIYKPTLYILSVGVSKYNISSYNLDYAHNDAIAIVDLFKKQEGKLYKKVVPKLLINHNATKGNLLDALSWIERQATQKDMVILFFSGHGENDANGNYYFISSDANMANLRRTALRWTEIRDTILNIPAKRVLLVDTCHSGNVFKGNRKGDITGAIRSITDEESGAVIITASTGRGYSIEKDIWQHGAFTKAIIDGFKGLKADYNNDGIVTIKDIDYYLSNRVKDLTDGQQKVTTTIPHSVTNFSLWVK